MKSAIKHEIAFLDFLRGWSAILVFFHHASILGGGPGILAGNIGQEAVNAFMLASGFLIYYQSKISKSYNGFSSVTGIKNFYIRRFFRIAPVYYFALIIALIISNHLGDYREIIAGYLPNTKTSMSRYYIDGYVQNFIAHITFVFGLIPKFAFSTPLPDWSLGLEMQFYLFFPLLFIFYKRNFIVTFSASLLMMFIFTLALKYFDINFPMPSFLPLKFHNFGAGIALAYLFLNKEQNKRKVAPYFITAITITFLLVGNKSLPIPILFISILFYLIFSSTHLAGFKRSLDKVFGHVSSKFLAEMSYSIYIIHLLIMIPYFGILHNISNISLTTWLIYSLLLLIMVIGISKLIYKYVELPGIAMGKNIINYDMPAKPEEVTLNTHI